jgi:acetylornithine/N-succinyldiaminopimelate aminotransferase
MNSSIMPTYGRLPVTFSRGNGVWLWDEHDNPYLDALSGIAVCNLGHAHPAVHKAICEQSLKLIHTSNLYQIEAQQQLAQQLTALAGMDNVFFANSGAEANEAAIKIARLYGKEKGIAKPLIISMNGSFHGRTMATLSATGNPKVKQGFEPLLDGFTHIPYNDIPALESTLQQSPNAVAVMLEPVQGEGGVNIPAPDYLNQVRRLCDQYQVLLILDEIQTGMGRTGHWFCHQHNAIEPDIMTLAKALGNGVPIGACLAQGKAAQLLTAGKHGSTFGGNPLACNAALAVIATLKQTDLIQQTQTKGQEIVRQLQEKLHSNPHVIDIRHKGLMLGIELDRPCGELVTMALKKGLLINVTAEKTIRLLPPLIIDSEQIQQLTSKLSDIIHEFTQNNS